MIELQFTIIIITDKMFNALSPKMNQLYLKTVSQPSS